MKKYLYFSNFKFLNFFKFLFALIFIFNIFNFNFYAAANAAQADSKSWKNIIDERTAVIWADAQFWDTIVLNARGNASITWLPRSLLKILSKNQDAEEWVINGLGFYYSGNAEIKKKLKGRDVVAVNYKAVKTWTFNPEDFIFENYKINSGDILSSPRDYAAGELNSGTQGIIFIAVPSNIMKPGRSVKISLGADSAVLNLVK